MTDEELLDALEDDGPNEPASLPLAGCSGPRDPVTPEQQRERREAMSALIAAGASDDQVNAAMGTRFNLKHDSIRRLKNEVLAQWDEEDAERKKYYKAAAIRRILGHIRKASSSESYTAVAMLERQLADIQDTNAPRHVRVEADFRLGGAILSVLQETDPVEVRRMIEEEGRRMLEAGDVIDTVGEPVEREAEPTAP